LCCSSRPCHRPLVAKCNHTRNKTREFSGKPALIALSMTSFGRLTNPLSTQPFCLSWTL
jgi:hypothetical protein